MPSRAIVAKHVLFAMVGMGSGWMTSDAIWAQNPTFVKRFAAGLHLPSYLAITAQTLSAATILALMLHKVFRRGSSQQGEESSFHRRVIWAITCLQFVCLAVLAFLWRATLYSWPIVLFITTGFGQVIGVSNSIVVLPFISTRCTSNVVSSVSTGVQLSSMMAGLLGIAQQPTQGTDEAFSTSVFFMIFAAIAGLSICSWSYVSGTNLGIDPTVSEKPLTDVVENGAEADEVSDGAISIGGMYAILLPLDIAAWGIAPSILPFAAGAVAGSCDSTNEEALQTLRYAISLSFVALPIAAFTTAILPTFRKWVLAAMFCVGVFAFAVELSILMHATFILELSWAPSVLIVSHFVMRFIDTYLMTTAFRLITYKFSLTVDKRRHSEKLGLVISICGFLSTLTLFLLIHEKVIRCE